MTQSTLIENVIRRQKNRWPTPVTLTNRVRTALNPISGVQTVSDTTVLIKKAILLPAKTIRRFRYDLAYLAGSGVAFTQGGVFDQTARFILIDSRDLKGFVPTTGTLVTIAGDNNVRECKDVATMHEGQSYILHAIGVDGVTNVG